MRLSCLCLLLAGPVLLVSLPESLPAAPPNFVFILADDLGDMDIRPNNPDSFYETPHLDQLAGSGMRFTDAYAANPVCSPTRYSIQTGRYPTRGQATNYFGGHRAEMFLPAEYREQMDLEEVTVAEALKAGGYQTAFVGKWHLGPTEDLWPEHQGYDLNLGGYHAGHPRAGYFVPYKNPKLPDGPEGEYLTDRLAEESKKIIRQFAGKPFLLFLSMYAVHTPLQAPEHLVRKYQEKARQLPDAAEFADEEQVWRRPEPRRTRIVQNHPVYAAMVESMDMAVGEVLQELDRQKLTQDTVVVFFSDNGGLSTAEGAPTSNRPLRGGKGWVYEGGIREPLLVRYPGVTAPGSVCHTPVCSIDMLPTLLDIAQLPLPAGREIDGVSLLPLLRGQSIVDRPLYWHYPHYGNQGGFPGGAIRQGDFKLIERYEDGRVQLYNLKEDIGEQNDLARQQPRRARQMRQKLHAWYQTVDAKFLRPREPWTPNESPASGKGAD